MAVQPFPVRDPFAGIDKRHSEMTQRQDRESDRLSGLRRALAQVGMQGANQRRQQELQNLGAFRRQALAQNLNVSPEESRGGLGPENLAELGIRSKLANLAKGIGALATGRPHGIGLKDQESPFDPSDVSQMPWTADLPIPKIEAAKVQGVDAAFVEHAKRRIKESGKKVGDVPIGITEVEEEYEHSGKGKGPSVGPSVKKLTDEVKGRLRQQAERQFKGSKIGEVKIIDDSWYIEIDGVLRPVTVNK